jgi:hypothetical protein
MTKQKLIKIITQVTDEGWWQPYGKIDEVGNYVIQEKDPFFWRINPKWAEEVASRILKEMKEENNE